MKANKKFLMVVVLLVIVILITKLKIVYDVFNKETGKLIGEAKQVTSEGVEYWGIVGDRAQYNVTFTIPEKFVTLRKRITIKF